MPIFKTLCPTDDLLIGVWKITEDEDSLRDRITLSPSESKAIQQFSSLERRLQWLSTRVMLQEHFQVQANIHYLDSGKPYLNNSITNLSISHTQGYVAIALNKTGAHTGIDVQTINNKILRIRQRFIHPKEATTYRILLDNLDFLHIMWCAKEALYKVHGNSKLFFKEHITLENLQLDKPTFEGQIDNFGTKETYALRWEKIEENMLVYLQA